MSPVWSNPSIHGSKLDVHHRTEKQSHEEESKTDYVMDRLVDDPVFMEQLRSRIKAMAMAMATQ